MPFVHHSLRAGLHGPHIPQRRGGAGLLGLPHLLRMHPGRRHHLVLGTATLTAVQVYVLLPGQHSWGRVLVLWPFLFLVSLQGGHGGLGLARVVALMLRRGGCYDRRDTNV